MNNKNESFGAAMKRLQTLAGHSLEQLETLKEAILSMSANERDTHFQGFAKLLYDELDESCLLSELCIEQADSEHPYVQKIIQRIQTLIAQRAYDLAYHTLKTAEEHDLFADNFYGRFSLDTEAKLTEIPDLAEWPKPD